MEDILNASRCLTITCFTFFYAIIKPTTNNPCSYRMNEILTQPFHGRGRRFGSPYIQHLNLADCLLSVSRNHRPFLRKWGEFSGMRF